MELIPKVLVVGLFAATQPGPPDRDRVNRIWSELSVRQDYRQLNMTGDAAQLIGVTPDDVFAISPPLLQFRSTARLGLHNAADEAQVAIRAASIHLQLTQFFNLGIKYVYHAPVPSRDARSFVLRKLLHLEDEEGLSALKRGDSIWVGLKYGVTAADESVYTLVVEPLVSDNNFLFIDLDAQFPGVADPDRIRDRAREVETYADTAVRRYLESAE